MKIGKLTLDQIKEIQSLNLGIEKEFVGVQSKGLNSMIGKKVIIRTYSAGVHYGTLSQKDGKEVILTNSRRMYRFWCEKSISLTGVAIHGIKHDKSRVCGAVDEIWLEAIEILPCLDIAINSIESCPEAKAQ